MRWWKLSFKPSRASNMPGSPYLDEPPKGLLTWPKLLRLAGPTALVFFGAAWYVGVLVEAMAVVTVTVLVMVLRAK